MRTIGQRELRNSSGRVLRDLAAGEDLLVTSNGEPIGDPARTNDRARTRLVR